MSREPEPIPLHNALARGVIDLGVRVMFGLTGSGNIHIAHAFARDYGGLFVRSAHEAGALQMAHGFASTSGELAVATVSPGPGVTNAVTGLVECVRGRLPVLVLVTDPPVKEKFHWQGIDHQRMVEPTGAGFEVVRSPETALRDLSRAAQRAVVESRPVVLDVPNDLLRARIPYEFKPAGYRLRQATSADEGVLEDAAALLASARYPIIIAGRGSMDAREAILSLSDRLGAPVATTLKAKGLFSGNDRDIGIFGTLSTPSAGQEIARSDCVLMLGASLNYRTTVGGELLHGKRVIQCDTDPRAIGATRPVDIGIVGDSSKVARQLADLLDEVGVARRSRTAFRQGDLPDEPLPSTGERVTADAVMSFLDAALPPERVVVTDGGNFVLSAWRLLNVAHPRRFVTTLDFGAIGGSVANAIGASYGAGDGPVVAVTGDGGFALGGLTEFHTAVREGIDLVVAVCNNGSYGPEYRVLVERGVDPGLACFDWPDFAAVATAMGGIGVPIQTPGDFQLAAKVIADRDRPVLLDIKLDPRDDPLPMSVSAV